MTKAMVMKQKKFCEGVVKGGQFVRMSSQVVPILSLPSPDNQAPKSAQLNGPMVWAELGKWYILSRIILIRLHIKCTKLVSYVKLLQASFWEGAGLMQIAEVEEVVGGWGVVELAGRLGSNGPLDWGYPHYMVP